MNPGGIIILLGCCLGLYWLISWRRWKSNIKLEEEAFNAMLQNPSDMAVYKYIPLFLAASKVPRFRPEANNYDAVAVNNKLRQSQGYPIIMQSPDVSDKAKEDLKKAYISNGVIVQ